MQIVTKLLDHLNIGEATPAPTAGVLAKELKDKSKKFKSFKTFNKWWNEMLRITTSKATKKAYKKAKGLLN